MKNIYSDGTGWTIDKDTDGNYVINHNRKEIDKEVSYDLAYSLMTSYGASV